MKRQNWLFILVGGCVAMSASAQDAKKDKDLSVELNPVVVTGTGTHHRLKDAPTPVEVITANEIKKAGITDFKEAMTVLAPSLSFSSNSMGDYLMMNGLGNSYVLVLVNGQKVNTDVANGNLDLSRINTSDIKRVEILKGAGSALYGSDAIAGVINIITNQPLDQIRVSSNTKVEGHGQTTQQVNLDVQKGMWGSYTSYTYRKADSWKQNDYDEDGDWTDKASNDGYSSNTFNQKFTFAPTKEFSMYAGGGYYDRNFEHKGYDYGIGYESYNLSIGAKYKMGRASYISLDLYNDNFETNKTYRKETSVKEWGESVKYGIGQTGLTKRSHYYNANLKGLFRNGDWGRTIVGLEYVQDRLKRPDALVDNGVYTLAAYAQEEVEFLKHFKATAGLRLVKHETAGTNLTPKASLMYNIGNFNLRGQYSGGFRAPSMNQLYYFMNKGTTLTNGNEDLKAEKSHYGSVNAEYIGTRFSVSATAYINQVDHMIEAEKTLFSKMDDAQKQAIYNEAKDKLGMTDAQVAKLKTYKKYANLEEGLIKGFEVNFNSNLGAGFSLGGSYTYAYARGKKYNEATGTTEWQNIDRSIRHSGSVNANYAQSWKNYLLNVNITGLFHSKRFHEASDIDESAPGYGIWNLSTRHSFGQFEIGLGMNNFLNKVDRRPFGVNYFSTNPGRTLFASLTIHLNK